VSNDITGGRPQLLSDELLADLDHALAGRKASTTSRLRSGQLGAGQLGQLQGL
jgi:hypothetical protein